MAQEVSEASRQIAGLATCATAIRLGVDGRIVGYALTPGYGACRGLGWYGVITHPVSAG